MQYDKQTKTLSIPQKHLEAWINSQENFGRFLVDMLGMDEDTFNEGFKDLEGFRVKIEADPAFAAQVETAANAGEGYQLPTQADARGYFTITADGIVEAIEEEAAEDSDA